MENGGKWWENGGKPSQSIEIPNAIKATGESFETNPDTERNWLMSLANGNTHQYYSRDIEAERAKRFSK